MAADWICLYWNTIDLWCCEVLLFCCYPFARLVVGQFSHSAFPETGKKKERQTNGNIEKKMYKRKRAQHIKNRFWCPCTFIFKHKSEMNEWRCETSQQQLDWFNLFIGTLLFKHATDSFHSFSAGYVFWDDEQTLFSDCRIEHFPEEPEWKNQ